MELQQYPRMALLTLAPVAIIALAAGACADPLAPLEPLSMTQAAVRDQPTFRYDSLIVPGATGSSAQGINAAGHIVGFYSTSDGRVHGFLFENGTYTTIDYDATVNTNARGIGPNDEIVGSWAAPSEPAVAAHGFRRTPDGQLQAVHYPGHLYEIPQRILPDGTILGCRHDHDTMMSMNGIMISRRDTSEISTFASMSNGATPDRARIVGLYTDSAASNRGEGFIIDHGVWSPLLLPGAASTAAWDVNPRGDVAGVFKDAAGFHGFVLTSAGYTPIDFPGASATRVFGINARGDVVGAYVSGGHTHGFVATRTN